MVHEDPDSLGYWKAPLSRSAAQGDLGAQFEPERHERAAAVSRSGYHGDYLYDLMSAPMQAHIVKAAQHHEDSALAEQHRSHAGYRWRIDPGGF